MTEQETIDPDTLPLPHIGVVQTIIPGCVDFAPL
jgi:hypothetical protein